MTRAMVAGCFVLRRPPQKHQLQRHYNQPPNCFCLYSPSLTLRQLRHTPHPVFLPTSPPPIPHISLTTRHRGHDSTLLFFPSQSQPNRPSYPFRNSSNSCRSPSSPPWAPLARVSVSEAERSRLVPHQISYYACSR